MSKKRLICDCCKKEFYAYLSHRTFKNKYCSRTCMGKIQLHPVRKDFVLRTGYKYIKKWGHPNCGKQGYVAEHRLIMEEKIGRFLKKEETIHHKDGNKLNNDIENLELCYSRGTHTSNYHPEIAKKQKEIFKEKRFSPKTEFKKGMIPHNKGEYAHSKEEVEKLYFKERLPVKEIANKLNCSVSAIMKYKRIYKIPRRPKKIC